MDAGGVDRGDAGEIWEAPGGFWESGAGGAQPGGQGGVRVRVWGAEERAQVQCDRGAGSRGRDGRGRADGARGAAIPRGRAGARGGAGAGGGDGAGRRAAQRALPAVRARGREPRRLLPRPRGAGGARRGVPARPHGLPRRRLQGRHREALVVRVPQRPGPEAHAAVRGRHRGCLPPGRVPRRGRVPGRRSRVPGARPGRPRSARMERQARRVLPPSHACSCPHAMICTSVDSQAIGCRSVKKILV
jgi:hypothetical protein